MAEFLERMLTDMQIPAISVLPEKRVYNSRRHSLLHGPLTSPAAVTILRP